MFIFQLFFGWVVWLHTVLVGLRVLVCIYCLRVQCMGLLGLADAGVPLDSN